MKTFIPAGLLIRMLLTLTLFFTADFIAGPVAAQQASLQTAVQPEEPPAAQIEFEADLQPVLPDTLVIIEAQTDADADERDEAPVEEALEEEVSQLRNLVSFPKILFSVLLLVGAWFVNGFLIRILDNLAERATNYRLFIKRLTPVTRIAIWTFAIYIVIAGVISPPFETVIALTASFGIAVGFASQDILRNIFGGIMIILDRPFQVGDKIQVGEHYGEVKSIGLRSCLIETPDDNTVAIPNGELMNRAVSNANSSALDCQVVAEIFIPATADVMLAKDVARRAVFSSPYLYMNKPVAVIALNELNNRGLFIKLRVKAYVLDIRYEFLFKSDMTEMIVTELNRLGILSSAAPESQPSPGNSRGDNPVKSQEMA
ncbi:Small-conductance mechanosensitive channel [Cyclonatronum proteinivorum]|uniref:Small-conductance mechanosensitive channel n=1 Tax=Cyclonatronum proteinivorum TaxID=1457365 RepID=A0A345UGQ1_9BACT|nr:mechanosensitive ion channel family protein [Cyclonatronum proteinivorum]AXI99652.1 Small-conductance mechanosensitive channel [Cyclonatronum proteinivorum]